MNGDILTRSPDSNCRVITSAKSKELVDMMGKYGQLVEFCKEHCVKYHVGENTLEIEAAANPVSSVLLEQLVLINNLLPVICGALYNLSLCIGIFPADTYDKQIILRKIRAQIAMQFAPFLYSTFFVISRRIFLSGHGEKCRIFLPRCRGPPLLKSRV